MTKHILVTFILLLTIIGCKKKSTNPVDTSDIYTTQKTQIKETYAQMAFAVYSDALTTAQTLKTAIYDFVDNPSSTTHAAAKTAWLNAREVYGVTEIFRFVDGPIDNTNDGPEGLINAWPMDEAYVDYVVGSPNAGIINNLAQYPTIDATTIVQANEYGGEVNISCGYHAIEFLLWGQDLSASSAGARTFDDYVVGGSVPNADRRGTYLKVCADLLVQALTQVKNAWDPAIPTSYYATWMGIDNNTCLRKIFNALRVLSGVELAGERIYVAYQNQDQEDEHSCFSDNTHRDIYLNALAIENLYKGQYTSNYGNSVTGYALEDLAQTASPDKNTTLLTRFATTMTKVQAMYTPFDQAIVLSAERPKVFETVQSLQQQKIDFESLAATFGITF